jgi:hypothetical protein
VENVKKKRTTVANGEPQPHDVAVVSRLTQTPERMSRVGKKPYGSSSLQLGSSRDQKFYKKVRSGSVKKAFESMQIRVNPGNGVHGGTVKCGIESA